MNTLHLIATAQTEHGEGHSIQQFGPGKVEVYDIEIVVHHERRQRQYVEHIRDQVGVGCVQLCGTGAHNTLVRSAGRISHETCWRASV